MEKIHKSTMLAKLRKVKYMEVYMAPSRVAGYHITSGWCLGTQLRLTIDRNNVPYLVLHFGEYMWSEPLEDYISKWSVYNLSSELGNRPRFWVESQKMEVLV